MKKLLLLLLTVMMISGDSTKCDDVDWVTLASDMFDMLQKCLMNY